jgi:hypothetical protein
VGGVKVRGDRLLRDWRSLRTMDKVGSSEDVQVP